MIKITILLFFIWFYSIYSFTQTKVIDSLSIAIENESNTPKKVKLLHEYVWELAYYDPAKSIEPAKEALKLAKELNDSSLIADSYNRIGLVFDYSGSFKLAEKNYLKAYEIKLIVDGEQETDGVLNNLGSTYYYLGRYNEALDYYLKSLRIRDLKSDNDDPHTLKPIGQSYNNLALLFKKQKDYEKAIKYYLKALDIKNKLKDTTGIITSQSNLGVLYMEQDSLVLAKEAFDNSLELAQMSNDKVSKAMILNNLGLLSMRKKHYKLAEEYYNKAILYYEEIHDSYGETATLINLGSLYLSRHNIQSAKITAERVLKTGRNQGAADVQLSALKLLSKVHEKINPALSLIYLKEYITLKDSISDMKIKKHINQQAIMYETEKKDVEIDLLKKDKIIHHAEIEKQNLIINRNRNNLIFMIIGIILILILSTAFVLYFRSRKEAAEERASKLRIKHQREMDNLRASLGTKIKVIKEEEINFDICRNDLNQYLLNPLSERELEVLDKISKGKQNKQIAEELFISINTVKTHVLHIYEKLAVQNRTEAAVKASELKILKKTVK